MVDINRKKCERNGVETMVDSDGIFWLNEKHTEGLDDKHLWVTAMTYCLGYRKDRYQHKFRIRLGFK